MAGLDRPITLHLQAEGHRDEQGRYVPGPVTDVRVWAQIDDGGEADTLTEGAVVVLARAVFAVRWTQAVIDTPPSRMEITDDNGRRWNVDTVTDFIARRRFVQITAVTEVVD